MPRGRKKKNTESNVAPECICCSDPLGESHQLIFDDIGIELELQKLLQQCFNLSIEEEPEKVQAVCSVCLNELIETYDIQEKEVEENAALDQHGFEEGGSGSKDDDELSEQRVSIKLEKEDDSDPEQFLLDGDYNYADDEDEFKTEMLEEDLSDSNSEKGDEDIDEYAVELDKTISDEMREILFNGSDEDEAENSQLDKEMEDDDEQYENIDYLEEVDQNFDFKGYKESILNSKFDDIVFPNNISCRICSELQIKHSDVIEHTQLAHCVEDFAYPCIVDGSCEPLKTVEDLSFHMVFKHYDLDRLTIYTQCTSCLKRFTDFPSFNKHSCHTAKTLSRTATQCEECGQVFQSNKRYRFHLQFHLEKHRPIACLICDKMFGDDNEFFEHIQYGHEQDIGFTCIRCDRKFTTEQNLLNHKKIHKLVRPYTCKICRKSYLYSQLLKNHIIAHHSKTNPFQCPICGQFLFKQTLLNKHIELHNRPVEKQVQSCNLCGLVGESEEETEQHISNDHGDSEAITCVEVINIDRVFCCEYCELAYASVEQLQKHREQHVNKDYYCTLCVLVYDEYKKLKTHKLTHIDYIDKRKTFPVMRHYMCDVGDCTRSYMQWTSLRSHKRNKHNDKLLIRCYRCDEGFNNTNRFNQHMLNVHGGAIHACPFCDKTYTSKMAIGVHVARKHNTTKVQCDECTCAFSNEYYLNRHKDAVHCSYKCNQCDRILKNAKSLSVHQRMVHEKAQRYFCQYCNKGYYNQCDCLEHEETVHEKVKKFKCELCDYQAAYKNSLTIHMRAHNNETPYKCTICSKGFRRTYALALHMKRHNNIRNFVCPYEGCECAYPNQGILNSHLRMKHPNGINVRGRKRRTIATPAASNEQRPRRRFDVPLSNVFIDDDDGLDDGVIGEPAHKLARTEAEGGEYETNDNPDDPVTYILSEIENPAVIVQRNESDHDYIVRPDDNKIYGNVIEEYEIEAAEVVFEGETAIS